jgi:septum formation protein
VLTAVAVHDGGRRSAWPVSVSRVHFAPLSAEASALRGQRRTSRQGRRVCHPGPHRGWIERIDGSYSGVMGLPLHETVHLAVAEHGFGSTCEPA